MLQYLLANVPPEEAISGLEKLATIPIDLSDSDRVFDFEDIARLSNIILIAGDKLFSRSNPDANQIEMVSRLIDELNCALSETISRTAKRMPPEIATIYNSAILAACYEEFYFTPNSHVDRVIELLLNGAPLEIETRSYDREEFKLYIELMQEINFIPFHQREELSRVVELMKSAEYQAARYVLIAETGSDEKLFYAIASFQETLVTLSSCISQYIIGMYDLNKNWNVEPREITQFSAALLVSPIVQEWMGQSYASFTQAEMNRLMRQHVSSSTLDIITQADFPGTEEWIVSLTVKSRLNRHFDKDTLDPLGTLLAIASRIDSMETSSPTGRFHG